MAVKRGDDPGGQRLPDAARAAERKVRRPGARRRSGAETDRWRCPARSDVATDNPVPKPPFWGDRIVKGIALADYAAYLDERATFMGQWGLQGARGGRARPTRSWSRPRDDLGCAYWLDRIQTEGILEAAVVYGYLPCVQQGRRPDRPRLERAAERDPVHLPPSAAGAAAVPR